MNNENNSHKYDPEDSLTHKVNVFHINTSFRFFHFSCDDCKFKTHCESVRHKSEICGIAHEARELLTNYTIGYVASFVSDDFYIKIKKKNKKHRKHEFESALLQLWSKYAVKTK